METVADHLLESLGHQKVPWGRSLYTVFCASIFLLAVPSSLWPQTTSVVEGAVTDCKGWQQSERKFVLAILPLALIAAS